MKKLIVIFLFLLILACAPPLNTDKALAGGAILKFEDLQKKGIEHELKVKEITKEKFTFELAEQARTELKKALEYYEQALTANNEAVELLEKISDERLELRKKFGVKTEKVIECTSLSLELLGETISHGEMTLTDKMKELIERGDKCESENNALSRELS